MLIAACASPRHSDNTHVENVFRLFVGTHTNPGSKLGCLQRLHGSSPLLGGENSDIALPLVLECLSGDKPTVSCCCHLHEYTELGRR